jgi:hypothetical protein
MGAPGVQLPSVGDSCTYTFPKKHLRQLATALLQAGPVLRKWWVGGEVSVGGGAAMAPHVDLSIGGQSHKLRATAVNVHYLKMEEEGEEEEEEEEEEEDSCVRENG